MNPQDGGQSDAGGYPGDITATTVGPAGATLSTDAVSVRFPAGALTAPVSVSVKRLGAESKANLPAASVPEIDGVARLASEVFAFTPHGTTFTTPVEIELPHDGEGNIVLVLDDERDTTWAFVPGATFEGGKARFQVMHFSVYAVASAARKCQRAFCDSLPDSVKCGLVMDPCSGQVDVTTDCGRGCGAGQWCTDHHLCKPCGSDFICSTTTAKCGVLVDECGASHDVNAECPAIKGCGALGSCTPNHLCGACTPYPTCAEALAAAGLDGGCHPAVPDGCGGTMDCNDSCPDG